MKLKPASRKKPFDNQLPLINIVFLMLVFFLLVGVIAPPEELDITPPLAATTGQQADTPGKLFVDASGQFSYAGNRAAGIDELIAQMGTAPENLTIAADAQTEAVLLMQAVSKLKAAGTKNLRLVTLRRQP